MAPSLLAPFSAVLPTLGGTPSSAAPAPGTPRSSAKAALVAAEMASAGAADEDLAARVPVGGIDWADEPARSPVRPKVTPRSSSARSSSSSSSSAQRQKQKQPTVHFPTTPLAATSSATASGSVQRSSSSSNTPTLSAQRLRASSAALSDLSSALKAQAAAERRRSIAASASAEAEAAAAGPSTPSTPADAAATESSSAKRMRFLSLPSKRPALPWLNSYTSSVRRALPRLPTAGVDIGEALGVEQPARGGGPGAQEEEERATSPPPSYEHARKAAPPNTQPNGLASPLMLPASRGESMDAGMLEGASSSPARATVEASASVPSAQAEEEDEAEEQQDPEYLVDLYVTSLTHLLSALPSDLAKTLPARQREALLAALREAVGKVEPATMALVRRSDVRNDEEEEVTRGGGGGPTRHEHVHAHHVYHHNPPALPAADTLKALPAPPSPQLEATPSSTTAAPSTTARVTAALAMPAFELLLSLTAASISLASRGAAGLVDVSAPAPAASTALSARKKQCVCDSHAAHATSAPTSPTGKELARIEEDLQAAAAVAAAEEKKKTGKGLPSEWEGPLALARAAAGMMYAQMASASSKGHAVPTSSSDNNSRGGKSSARKATSLPTSPRLALSSLPEEETTTALIRASDAPAAREGSLPMLARALKRSPLPAALSSSLSLLSASAERLGVRERAADVALKGASSGLRYVREHELHLYAMRAVWEGMEECVRALEAYREEESWEGGRKRLEGA